MTVTPTTRGLISDNRRAQRGVAWRQIEDRLNLAAGQVFFSQKASLVARICICVEPAVMQPSQLQPFEYALLEPNTESRKTRVLCKPLQKKYVEAFAQMLNDNTMRRHGVNLKRDGKLCLRRRMLNERMAKHRLQRADHTG